MERGLLLSPPGTLELGELRTLRRQPADWRSPHDSMTSCEPRPARCSRRRAAIAPKQHGGSDFTVRLQRLLEGGGSDETASE